MTPSDTDFARAAIPPRVLQIIRDVAHDHGFSAGHLIGPCRNHDVCRARYDAYARIRAVIIINGLPPSATLIGRWFGGRDHTSVQHGLRAVAAGRCAPPGIQEARAA